MALIAEYNESYAYIEEEDLTEEEIKDGVEAGYDEDLDLLYWDDFKYQVENAFSKRKFPVVLQANNSNWRGQTGYAKADSVTEILDKISSFESSKYQLHKTRGGALHFSLATHDVPTGFTIDIKPYRAPYLELLT